MLSINLKLALFFVVCNVFVLVEMAPKNSKEKKECEHKPHGHGPPPFSGKCLGEDLKFTEEQLMSIETCRESNFGKMNMTDGARPMRPPMKKITCHMACVTRSVGLFDGKGKPVSEAEIKTAVMAIFPEKAQMPIMDAFKDCTEKHGTGLVMKDGDCSSYRDFMNCVHFPLRTTCDPEYLLL